MKIQALAVLKNGEGLKPFEYDAEVGANDVLVDLKFCSMTRGDIRFMQNFWNDTNFPLVPSSEMFGTIQQVGSNVKDFEVGDYVGIGYQMSSCHECEYCKAGKEQFCHSQKVLAVGGYGGLAKQIIFDGRFIFKIPPELQNPKYVSLMCSGLTVYSAIKRGNPQSGMKVGVVGVGNLGHLAIQILNKMECKVTAFSHTLDKQNELLKLGAVEVIDSTSPDALRNCKNQFDFIISTSSKSLDWSQYISALKPLGNLMFVGLPETEVNFPAELLADYAQRGVLGSYIGSPAEMIELLEFAKQNEIYALSTVYPVSEIKQVVAEINGNQSKFSTIIDLSSW